MSNSAYYYVTPNTAPIGGWHAMKSPAHGGRSITYGRFEFKQDAIDYAKQEARRGNVKYED